MNILVFSLGVVFKNTVQGGSQKVLRDIARGLANKGHKITIVCPRRKDNHEEFEFCPRAIVKPILPLRGAFPMPYAVPPFSLVETVRLLEQELKTADLLYCHDGGLLIESLKQRVPVVISLRDYCYQETLLGALNFNGNSIIVNSMHTYLCLQDSFQQLNHSLDGKVRMIYNGYDSDAFQRKAISEEFYREYGLPRKNDTLMIGFPHRPEMSKGFFNALNVVKQLSDDWGSRVKLLIPMYMDRGLSERTDDTYYQIRSIIDELKLQENIVYHKWVRHNYMPEYYSYCDVTLCIGNYVEAYSNVSIESLLCGTPVVAATTSTYRTMQIRKYLHIVPYGAIEETARVVHEILSGRADEKLVEARAYISEELTVPKMVDAYEQTFLQAIEQKNTQKAIHDCGKNCLDSEVEESYRLAAWCTVLDGKIYNDYYGEYLESPLGNIFSDTVQCVSKQYLLRKGMNEGSIHAAISDGILVRCR